MRFEDALARAFVASLLLGAGGRAKTPPDLAASIQERGD
jgi:hypothetical protein